MANVGDKYIVEIAEIYASSYRNAALTEEQIKTPTYLYRIKGFNSLVFEENGLNKLERYDEDEKANADYNSGYYDGLNDAWDVFKKFYSMNPKCFLSCFPGGNDELYSLHIKEVIERVKSYEEQKKAKEESIKVGDEVLVENKKFVVLHCANDSAMMALIIDGNGNTDALPWRDLTKTGRHFDIEGILKAMREE